MLTHFTIHETTHIGGRQINQDRLAHAEQGNSLLLVLADGMGGHPRGELAAEIAVETFVQQFYSLAQDNISNVVGFLNHCFIQAHENINSQTPGQAHAAPRTTCVACLIQDGIATWGHVGDSRLYFWRQGSLLLRTEDHTNVDRLLIRGDISEATARAHNKRHQVFNCLGGEHWPKPSISDNTPLEYGDRLLLCSDGVWGPLDETEITALSKAADHRVLLATALDKATLDSAHPADNASLIRLQWHQGQPAPAVNGADNKQSSPSDEEILAAIAVLRGNSRHHSPS